MKYRVRLERMISFKSDRYKSFLHHIFYFLELRLPFKPDCNTTLELNLDDSFRAKESYYNLQDKTFVLTEQITDFVDSVEDLNDDTGLFESTGWICRNPDELELAERKLQGLQSTR